MGKIIPVNRKICSYLDLAVVALSFIGLVGLIFSGIGQNIHVLISMVISIPLLIVSYIYLNSVRNITVPIVLNFVVATIYGVGLAADVTDLLLIFYGFFALFVIILVPGNKYCSVSYSDPNSEKDMMKIPKHMCWEDVDVEQLYTDLTYADTSKNDSTLLKLTSPDRFGIMSLVYGIALVVCNILFDSGLGNIVGFALFALYGAYILISEKDYSSWGRFKYVHRFILVFGLSYVIRGLIGGGEIDRGSSVIEGILLIISASYMSAKVYRMASSKKIRSIFKYGLVWLIVVIFFALIVIGMPLAIVEAFEESDILYSIANIICAIITFVVSATILLYFLLYCRPKQMYHEVEDNQELRQTAITYNQNFKEYTYLDAMRDARAGREKSSTIDMYTDIIKKAFEGAGYKLDYNTESDIRKLLESYYPDISRSDIQKIVDTLISSSYGDIDSYEVKQHLYIPPWMK